MDYLIETLVYYSQLVVYHVLVVPHMARSSYRSTLERNPDWLRQNPEALRGYPPPRLSIGLSWALALLLAIAMPLSQVQMPTQTALSALFVVSTLAFLLQALVYYLARIRPLAAQIPAPPVRSAPIQRRDLGDFVRPIWLVVAALLNAAIVSVFVGGYLTGAITGELLMRRTVGIVIGLALAAGLLCYGLRRKPSRADEMLQGTYRLREVQLYVALFYLMAFVGLFRIGTDFLDIHLFTVLSYFVVNSVVVQALFFVLISASRGREQPAAVDLGADPHMAG